MSDAIAVDSAIPIPPSRFQQRESRYPWGQLAVGQSFFVGCPDGCDLARLQRRLTSVAGAWRRSRLHQATGSVPVFVPVFTVRVRYKDRDGEVADGVRVWRQA